jgi:hypothetical protein
MKLKFRDTLTDTVKVYDNMTEIAPGFWVGDIPPPDIPPVGFVAWAPAPGQPGLYRPAVRTFQPRIRLTKDIGTKLGVHLPDGDGGSRAVYDTIRRLIMAGFIRAGQMGPGGVELDIQSFWSHYQLTQRPGFWTPERRRQYRARSRGTIMPEES